jgi:hypothetical protein
MTCLCTGSGVLQMPACHGGGQFCVDAECTATLAVSVPAASVHSIHDPSIEATLCHDHESPTRPLLPTECARTANWNQVHDPFPPPPLLPAAPPPPIATSTNPATQPGQLQAAAAIQTLVNDLQTARLQYLNAITDLQNAPVWKSYRQLQKRKKAETAFKKQCKRAKKELPMYAYGAQELKDLETQGSFLVPTTVELPSVRTVIPTVRFHAGVASVSPIKVRPGQTSTTSSTVQTTLSPSPATLSPSPVVIHDAAVTFPRSPVVAKTRTQSTERTKRRRSSCSVTSPVSTVASTMQPGDPSVPISTLTTSEILQNSLLELSTAKQTMDHWHGELTPVLALWKSMLSSTSDPLSGTKHHHPRHTHTFLHTHVHTHKHTHIHT